jgi:esterase FrsA
MEPKITALNAGSGVTLYHTGPALDHGPLPAVFYFALSGPDSLTLDPFNQPVRFLMDQKIRLFSLTLPGHENSLPATQAIQLWAEDMARGIDCLGNFLEQAETAFHFALAKQLIDPHKCAAAGLSRGGFLAAHFAARLEKVRFLLAFAPITKLHKAKEFAEHKDDPKVLRWDLEHLAPSLCDRHVRLYIGNCDTRVGTRSCFDFAESLVTQAVHKKIRSPQIELFLTPSIGQMGHGTSPEVFRQGADWLVDCFQ